MTPILVNASQEISGEMVFTANERFSHDIDLTVRLDGTKVSAPRHQHLSANVE
jgi:hypothetical protein